VQKTIDILVTRVRETPGLSKPINHVIIK